LCTVHSVPGCTKRTDNWLSFTSTHRQTAACKASAAMRPGRHACILDIKPQTTAKPKRSNPLSKMIDANQSSSKLALDGPTELSSSLEPFTISATTTYRSISASCSYVHAFEVCTCTHHHMSFCDYAGPPKTQGEEGQVRHRTSPPYSLATSASETQQCVHNFDSSYIHTCQNSRLQFQATCMMNSLQLERKCLI